MIKILTAIFFLTVGFANAQTKPVIKSERKIYSRLIKNEWKRGDIGCYDEYLAYNEKGKLIKRFDVVYNEDTRKDSLRLEQQNFYQNDLMILEEHYDFSHNLFWDITWQYDSLGRAIASKKRYLYPSGNEKSSGNKITETSYPTSTTSEEIIGSYISAVTPPEEYKMEPNGRVIIPKAGLNYIINHEKVTHTFDAAGNKIKSVNTDAATNQLLRTIIYRHNEQKQLIYEKAVGINPYTVTYQYNKEGNLKKETFKGNTSDKITDYKYSQLDKFDNWTMLLKTEIKNTIHSDAADLAIIKTPNKSIAVWHIKREINY